MKHAGGTFSGHKLFLCVPEVNIVGHTCNYQGCIPDRSCVARIGNWPPCRDVSDVRGFLGTCSVVRVFIHNFAELARPLVELTKKGVEFSWADRQQSAMDVLKSAVILAPALCPIDYLSGCQVIVAVDSSQVAVGWIVYQLDSWGQRKPSCYGSIAWNEREARYSQAKIELYGMYWCLRALQMHIVGLPRFSVEVDAKYIRGMLNNPDIQPNNAMNRWIAGILLFDFELVHIPGSQHGGPDGLSQRRMVDVEEPEDDWVDEVLELGVWVNTWLMMDIQHTFLGHVTRDGQCLRASSLEGKGCCGEWVTVSFLSFSLFDILANDVESEVSFPRSVQEERADEQLRMVADFLSSGNQPTGMDEVSLKRFLHQALQYFFKAGVLWRRHSSGLHQQVILHPAKRMDLLTQAHDQLGHKGFFSTQRLVSDCFWWPGMDRDIKWFLQSCHQCQLRSCFGTR